MQALRLKPDLAYLTNSKEARVDEAECAWGSGKRRARRRRLGIGHGEGCSQPKDSGFYFRVK